MVSPLSINFWERVRRCRLDRLAQVQLFSAMLLYAPLERSQLAVRILSGVALLKIQQQFLSVTTWIDFQL